MSSYLNKHYLVCDTGIEPMAFVLELDLDMVKMYHHTKNEVSVPTATKVITHTHTHTTHTTHTHTTHTTKTLSLQHT